MVHLHLVVRMVADLTVGVGILELDNLPVLLPDIRLQDNPQGAGSHPVVDILRIADNLLRRDKLLVVEDLSKLKEFNVCCVISVILLLDHERIF